MTPTHVIWKVPHTEHYMAQVRLELPAYVILISKSCISREIAEAWCKAVEGSFNRDTETTVLERRGEIS